ncbi:MAG: SPOR domain-containing protein [Bacteroidota bacterium]|nr:SPOR domain-containing protein [Bacteroidota bacterium]
MKFSLICTLMLVGVSSAVSLPLLGNDSTFYTPKKEKLSMFERSFKPSYYDNEVYLFKKNDSAQVFGTAIDQMTSAMPETLQGFRIQLLSTNDYDEALAVRNSLNTTYPELWVYAVFESPSYKIRVGDYGSRSEAKIMLDKLKQEGYKSAWIVPDEIIKNQPPKPPLPAALDSTAHAH